MQNSPIQSLCISAIPAVSNVGKKSIDVEKHSVLLCDIVTMQLNLFLDRLHGNPIGFSVLGIFVIEKNTILTVCIYTAFC